MLRIDPAHPPLWRDADCLQFGVDDAARLDAPEPWEEALVAMLMKGAPPSGVRAFLREHDVDPDRADAFFAELQPVLRDDPPRPRIVLQTDAAFSPTLTNAMSAAMERAGAVVSVRPWANETIARDAADAARHSATVLAIAAHRLDPRRAGALLREDARHLPLVFDGAGAIVGPLVEPGVTGCLACVDAHASDRDGAWPLVAAQLLGRRAPELDQDLLVEAVRVAVRMVSARGEGATRPSVRLRADSLERRWRQHPPHEECRCRSLGESGREPAPSVPTRAPSSPRGFARPA